MNMLPPISFDLILNLDYYLSSLVTEYGALIYVILFVVLFIETGVVVIPFLPGDSLLFVAGALAALGSLDIILLFALLSAAAIMGDTANYWIGHHVGKRAYKGGMRFINKRRLEQAEKFFRKHGGKTIIVARFVPFVRTFAPFIAGIGAMEYKRFIGYNITGGIAWVGSFLAAGYLLGNMPVIRDNLSLFLLSVIVISIAAAFTGFIAHNEKTRS